MNDLIAYQNNLLSQTPNNWFRSLLDNLHWEQRLLGLKGLRGVGKTTLMLQYLKHYYPKPENALYVTADAPWFYSNSLYQLTEQWSKYGGKLLMVDEIHKYPQWSRELKVAYDGHPDMQFIFSASSAFDVFKGEVDLSRRAIVRELPGMSFREYLAYQLGIQLPAYSLEQIIQNAASISKSVSAKVKPLPHFREYLKTGYFPFSCGENEKSIAQEKFQNTINTILESDLAFIQDYSPANILKLKRLLGVIADAAPFEPNVSKIANKLNIGRVKVYNYLKHLADARLLNFINKAGKSVAVLQKPSKIYFENTNLATAFGQKSDIGAMRETFFFNQLKNTNHQVALPNNGDFIVDDTYIFEVGGPNKTTKQIRDMPNSYLALDDIEYGFGKTIPIWLFGFLY